MMIAIHPLFRKKFRQLVLATSLGLIALVFILPLCLIISISLSSETALAQYSYQLVPVEFTLDAYAYILKNGASIAKAFSISIVTTVLGVFISITLISLYSYAISRKDFLFRKFFTFYIFFTMLFNGGLVPTYLVVTKILHLQNTIFALIVPLAFNAFFAIVLRTFFQNIPVSLTESGRMDGAGEWRIFMQLVLPISVPGIATIGLFSAVSYWNDWFQALLYIRNPDLLPLQAFLAAVQQNIEMLSRSPELLARGNIIENLPQESSRMAIVVITTLPILLSYPLFQRFFISGLTVGAIKE